MDLEHAKEAWDEWEIHCLILVSLCLQVFLSLTADLRRRSASRVLSTILWLAYLSADTVAVFVLGHLAVHAQGPSHELMLFWAPFVLVHLGGQDSITAFSKQDNELWTRHLLSLVTQTAVAGYVVSKSSWPDGRLRAAMVLMFLCGFFKYAGRTYCLYSASPKILRASSMDSLSRALWRLRDLQRSVGNRRSEGEPSAFIKEKFEAMFHADKCLEFIKGTRLIGSKVDDIMLMDTPVDDWMTTHYSDVLPDMLKEKNLPDRCIAYQYVAASLVRSYRCLYTKASLLSIMEDMPDEGLFCYLILVPFVLAYTLFQCISTAIALVLFASAQKVGHHSKADITVSYILLVGAIVLDLLPALTSIVSYARKPFRPQTLAECASMSIDSCVQPRAWPTIRKQWSEELAQYSMTRRYACVRGDHGCMSSIWQWTLKFEFLDLARTPVTDDLKLFVLDKLLLLQTRWQEWDFANFRGQRALGKWMDTVPEPAGSSSGYAALHESLSSRVEYPTSVLIWHIATEIICYFSKDNGRDIENDETMMTMTKRKKRSRELSQYIMYLVFKCDVMLTTKSRLQHYEARQGLKKILLDEVLDAMKKEEEPMQSSILQSTEEALYSPVLPRARAVAQELIRIEDEARRWELISEVWLEMLFYTAPRCGPDFHYEHLSTGGEFISHVLLLMRSLGPFMPKSGA